ncbi:MAG: serine protease [Candidatus Acidiferrum sp.]
MRLGFLANRVCITAIAALAALGCAISSFAFRQTKAQTSTGDAASAALCPVVYKDDQNPVNRGYHYTFYGNAFFINDQGYLLTVAHVLESFGEGGQPYILVDRRDAPPQLLKAAVIAKDLPHDVAILRATPNPFAGKYDVAYLPLNSAPAVRGESVLALSLHPQRLQNAYSLDSPHEDSSAGTVLSYETTQLANPGPAADVFLLSHPVVKGQSGSPVIDVNSRSAVGLVEGLWLRGVSLSLAKSARLPTDTPGAAIPIRYAIALLDQQGIKWHSSTPPPSEPSSSAASPSTSDRPKP